MQCVIKQTVMTDELHNFSAFLSLLGNLILPEQTELIEYKAVSIKYDHVHIFGFTTSMQIISFFVVCCVHASMSFLAQLYFF